MARPAYERVGKAFRTAYETAGLRQGDVADALGVDQGTVSRWARGLQKIDLDAFPLIDELCGRPRGYVLRLAGYIEDTSAGDLEQAVKADPHLNADERRVILGIYDLARKRSVSATR